MLLLLLFLEAPPGEAVAITLETDMTDVTADVSKVSEDRPFTLTMDVSFTLTEAVWFTVLENTINGVETAG